MGVLYLYPMPLTKVSSQAEFGLVNLVEPRKRADKGQLRPILCACDDGCFYYVKSPSIPGWPLALEWICARLGRQVGIRIPNYRQIVISESLVEAWNGLGGDRVMLESGIGFGSQAIQSPGHFTDFEKSKLSAEEASQLAWFDWWIRNADRRPNNPNLVWSPIEETCYVIDHDQAGFYGTETEFWAGHLLGKPVNPISSAFLAKMRIAAATLPTLLSEIPSGWTLDSAGLQWFVDHLTTCIANDHLSPWSEFHE